MSYTDAEKGRAVTLAITLGDARAASKRTGIPRRTVSRWLASARSGEGQVARVMVTATASRKELTAQLWQAVEIGAGVLMARLSDPDARLGDVANALRVAIDAHAAMTALGQRTLPDGTVQTVDFEAIDRQQAEDRRVLNWLDQIESASDKEIADYLANSGLAQIRDASRRAADD